MEHVCYIVGAAPLDGRLPQPREGDYLIAADAGYTALRDAGLTPDLVIGDFDSLGAAPEHPHVLSHDPVKDDTDTILAIRWALERGYRTFELYGVLGGRRLDLTVASFQTLRLLRMRGASGTLVGEGWNVTVLDHAALRFPPEAAGTLSVFCAGAPCTGVTLRGLKYTMDDGVITGAFPIGVSNAFTGRAAEISVKKGMLYVLWQGDVRPEEVSL
ncbi:MAG: thiamine diphosphokinase [Oscillospiraceae bacterium]|nr:thiamine diphosphokinase [Oscillospiraceae bacterium]